MSSPSLNAGLGGAPGVVLGKPAASGGGFPGAPRHHHHHHHPVADAPGLRRGLAHHTIHLPPAAMRHRAAPRASSSAPAGFHPPLRGGLGVSRAFDDPGSGSPARRLVATRAWSASSSSGGGDPRGGGAPGRASIPAGSSIPPGASSPAVAGRLPRSARHRSAAAGASESSRASSSGGGEHLPDFADARIPAWVTLTRRRWDAVTMSMASMATVPFLFLTMPQIIKNTALIAAGRPEALAAIAWQGQVAGLLGNLLLLSYFADKGELSASLVQVVGVCATAALLTQITLAGHIPVAPFLVAGSAVAIGLIVSLARMLGRVGPVDANGVPCVGNVQCAVDWDEPSGAHGSISRKLAVVSNGLWAFYQGALGVVGLAALPQVGLASLLPERVSTRLGLAPGLAGAALGVVLVVSSRVGALPPAVASAWGKLSGWTATLLFMTMPVAQLAANFARPATLEGLSVASAMLAMLGNALMVPRALYTRDVIWLTGSTWGSALMGWGVMLSLFLGRHADGTRYVSVVFFSSLTAAFFLYLVVVWIVDGVSALAAGYHAGWRLKAWNFQGMSVEQPRTEIKKRELARKSLPAEEEGRTRDGRIGGLEGRREQRGGGGGSAG